MGVFSNDSAIEGELFIQRLSSYIRRNEESLANGLVYFLKNKSAAASTSGAGAKSGSGSGATVVKPLRLNFTIHHLYFIQDRLESSTLGVEVGPLNIKLDNPNHEPTFISFMANNARTSKHFDSDARSISSMNSMKSIVSSASMYWRSVGFSKDPKVINKDLRYLYSSFTKIPCLVLTPKTKMNSISGYEEYPCDTSVPLIMFKNLQVLEIVDYEPNEVFGWHVLSEQLRILIIKNSKISDLAEIIFNLVIDDESGRSSFSHSHSSSKHNQMDFAPPATPVSISSHQSFVLGHRKTESTSVMSSELGDDVFKNFKRERANTFSSSTHANPHFHGLSIASGLTTPAGKNYQSLSDHKWAFLKQLTISEASITNIPTYIFKPLSNLVKLNLSNNLLESIPEGLNQLTSLKYLNLADNLLTDLKNLPNNLKYLSTLNLNNNKLKSLDGFNNLYYLEKVDLRRNALRELSALKPIVLQYIKNPDKFNNVYLANNLLPKSFRIDLFNLFNGIKNNNNMKIDDSRPGYFESALLLDSEAAFKAFEKFFGLIQETPKSHVTTTSLADDNESLSNSLRKLDLKDESKLNSPATTTTSPHTHISSFIKATSPLSNNQNLTNTNPHSSSSSTVLPSTPVSNGGSDSFVKQTITPPPALYARHNSIPSSITLSTPTPAFLHQPRSNSSSQVSGLKKSPTLNQLDLDSVSAAPSVITAIQVTARMSS